MFKWLILKYYELDFVKEVKSLAKSFLRYCDKNGDCEICKIKKECYAFLNATSSLQVTIATTDNVEMAE
jgi:hypothetical protein